MHDQRVVGIGDDHRVGAARPRGFPPWPWRSPPASEVPDVRGADVGPDAHVRLRHADERPDLAGVVHPELHDRDLGAVLQLHQRHRQPDVVVVVPRLRIVRNRRDNSVAIASLVVVFPALPVMATTFAPDARRTYRAAPCCAA